MQLLVNFDKLVPLSAELSVARRGVGQAKSPKMLTFVRPLNDTYTVQEHRRQ